MHLLLCLYNELQSILQAQNDNGIQLTSNGFTAHINLLLCRGTNSFQRDGLSNCTSLSVLCCVHCHWHSKSANPPGTKQKPQRVAEIQLDYNMKKEPTSLGWKTTELIYISGCTWNLIFDRFSSPCQTKQPGLLKIFFLNESEEIETDRASAFSTPSARDEGLNKACYRLITTWREMNSNRKQQKSWWDDQTNRTCPKWSFPKFSMS